MCSLWCHPATIAYFNYLRFYHILLSYASFFDTSMVNKSLILNTALSMPLPLHAAKQGPAPSPRTKQFNAHCYLECKFH
jgi:hypothetical protein